MADKMSGMDRSFTMSQIKSFGNKSTEVKMIAIMRQHRINGWRRNQKVLGKPDFVFWKPHIALFIDGCFWHGCTICKLIPKSNNQYWIKKIKNNRKRDRYVTKELQEKGWQVVRFWEHSLLRPAWVARKLLSLLTVEVRVVTDSNNE
jgi:DNA mismatch endonuclease, patch repair protein